MTSDPVRTNEIAETFDELAHDRCCKYKSKGLTASTEVLLGLLTENGLVGKTLLDIGCGTGFFAWRRSDKEHLPASELTSHRLRFTRLTSSLGNPASKIERSSKSQTRLRLNTPPTLS